MSGRLAGKVALVTGSGQGIGFGIARVMARESATVWVNDLVEERAAEAAARIKAEGGRRPRRAVCLTTHGSKV